jgi:hypothetical protein
MKPLVALILALILPMRGIASLNHCDAFAQAQATAPHCASGEASSHSHGCGDCCGVTAIASAPPRLDVPRGPAAQAAERHAWLRPALTIDRLDRPPRRLAAG